MNKAQKDQQATELLGHVLICYRILKHHSGGPGDPRRLGAEEALLLSLESLDQAIAGTPLSNAVDRGVANTLEQIRPRH